jgi:hypothetical protein
MRACARRLYSASLMFFLAVPDNCIIAYPGGKKANSASV